MPERSTSRAVDKMALKEGWEVKGEIFLTVTATYQGSDATVEDARVDPQPGQQGGHPQHQRGRAPHPSPHPGSSDFAEGEGGEGEVLMDQDMEELLNMQTQKHELRKLQVMPPHHRRKY